MMPGWTLIASVAVGGRWSASQQVYATNASFECA